MNKFLNQKIVEILAKDRIIAYPTEAVYGLGCDPFNKTAVHKILTLKNRSADKGLILIASSWNQLKKFTIPIPQKLLQKALASWPGPNTWIFPASKKAPPWITGSHNTIAIRITAHPVASKICQLFNGAIVSTSANIEGEPPLTTFEQVKTQFGSQIDLIIAGNVGTQTKPTTIKDLLTDKILR